MVLADRIRLANTRQLLRAFGGLNETYGCSEAEYSAGVNFSTRDFPALSTRTPRRRLRALTGLNGMYHLNGLLTVCGRDVVYTPDDAAAPAVTKLDAVTDGRKALVGIGTKILIFPDKLAFDTADGSVTALGALWTAARGRQWPPLPPKAAAAAVTCPLCPGGAGRCGCGCAARGRSPCADLCAPSPRQRENYGRRMPHGKHERPEQAGPAQVQR